MALASRIPPPLFGHVIGLDARQPDPLHLLDAGKGVKEVRYVSTVFAIGLLL